MLYKADRVPVGEDQLAHLELAREIVRRFKHFYKKDIFPEPEALLTKEARILGMDRRKMSKSYGNAINLSDPEETIRKKVQSMITDPSRIKVSDPGHPEICNVYSYYQIFADKDLTEAAYTWCTGAKKGCTDCKKEFASVLAEKMAPIRKRRGELEKNKDFVNEILKKGHDRASAVAKKTLSEVKGLLHLWV